VSSEGGLPVGTVTFLFTDVVGSTALWERSPDTMAPAMARHDELVEGAVAEAEGMLVELARQAGHEYKAAFESQQLGGLLVELGRPEEALPYLEASERYAITHQHPRMLAGTAVAGIAHLDLGNVDKAVAIVRGRSDWARESGDVNAAIMAELVESDCLAAAGDHVGAARLLARGTRTCIDNEYGYYQDPLLVGAAVILVSVDPSTAAWLVGAAVSLTEAEDRRVPPRMERSMFRVESEVRAALGDAYDAVWRAGAQASPDEALARALAALTSVASGAEQQ
jgi:class 3 adenylate cyclase